MEKKSRTIFIGDIHGCYDEFMLLLNKIEFNKMDIIYCVGDMINKGPKSYKLLKFLYKNQKQFICIKGNNEVNFLKRLKGDAFGNNKTHIIHNIYNKISYKIKRKKTDYLIEFLQNLPLYIEKSNFIVLHGGLIPGKEISEHTEDELTRIRSLNGELWYKKYNGKKRIIYGHNALDGLQVREKTIGLDSGCVYGKSLTAYVLETGEIYSQNALSVYEALIQNKGK